MWRSSRAEGYRVEVLTYQDVFKGYLDGVLGGSLESNAFRPVVTGGTLQLATVPPSDEGLAVTDVDWLADRLRVVYTIHPPGRPDEAVDVPLGIYLPARKQDVTKAGNTTSVVTLLDKLTILDQDKVRTPYGLRVGANLAQAVEDLVLSTGELRVSVQPSAATARVASVWPAGTPKLTIANQILESAGYGSLWVDHQGVFQATVYVAPADRPVVWDFAGGADSVTADEYGEDMDAHAIPNVFVAVGQATDTVDALVGVAENNDPASPYSYARRRRWVSASDEGVQAASQAIIDQIAQRRLLDSATPAVRMDLAHLLVGLDDGDGNYRPMRVDDAVLNPNGLRTTVAETTIQLAPGQLATSTLRRFEGITW